MISRKPTQSKQDTINSPTQSTTSTDLSTRQLLALFVSALRNVSTISIKVNIRLDQSVSIHQNGNHNQARIERTL